MFTQLPADGHYFWNLFPGMLVGGIGLALSFVPVTIAGLTGVQPGRRGHRVGAHQHEPPGRRRGGPRGGLDDRDGLRDRAARRRPWTDGLTNGFQTGFLVLSGVALLGAVIAATLLAPPPEGAEVELFNRDDPTPLEEAA